MTPETVLITGAASGIGLALAREFARHDHPLILTSRVHSELVEVGEELANAEGIDVRTIAVDLEEPGAAQKIFDFARRESFDVDVLVNNAGLGFRGKFWEIPLQQQLSIVRVNIDAVLSLTHLFLPPMLSRNRGRIMNTASIAGFEPGPNLAAYHASKAFVLSFTEALATEVEETGIKVCALCPGPTDTDFFPKAHMESTRAFQKTDVMSPQEVAQIGYRGLMKGDRTIVPGAANKALVFARRFMSQGAQAKMNEKFYEDVDPADRKRKRGDIESRAE